MNRTPLERAFEKRAVRMGYGFRCAAAEYLSQDLPPFPAAWLLPPQLRSAEGRTRGRVTYDVTLHLLRDGARLDAPARSAAWAAMEEELLALFTSLSDEPDVLGIEGLTLRARTYALTNRGEIAQSAEARVVTWFSRS